VSRWMFGGVLLLAILSASGVVPTLAHASDSGSAAATSAEAFAPLVLAQSSGPPSRGEGARAQRARRAHERAQQEARLAAERSRTRGRDYEFNALRSLVLVAGIGIFVWGLWLSRNGKKRLRKIQLALLFLVALASFASYYQFFTVVRHGGFRTPDNFHYYVGSKYFDSLGYYGLYDCSLAALTAQGARTIRPDQPVRDLRTMRTGTAAEALIRGRECEQRFTPERWRSFGKDVDWFSRLWPPHIWKAIWDDHGYHPTPVWNVIGGVIAEAVPTDDTDGIRMLTLADRYLVGLGLLAIGWAFGLEAACLATLVWGTGHLWRYTFVGDAYFRHFWWLSAVLGVCLLRRAWPSLAGASLGLSALLRLFPGALSLAFLVHATRASIRAGKLAPSGVRFIAGAALASGVFLGWALLAEAGGVSVFVAFAEKMRAFTQVPASNKVGLDVAMMWIFGVDEPASRASAWLLRLLFLYAFWRGLRNAEGWEAAAFGWTLIPILTDPTSYYYSFVMLGAVLAIRRPRIALILLFSCLAWNVNGLLNYREYVEYWYASIVAVLCTGAIAFEMGRAPSVAVAAVPEIEALPDPAGQG
jgi:hypothetical protein